MLALLDPGSGYITCYINGKWQKVVVVLCSLRLIPIDSG